MKLLFDENLSPHLVQQLAKEFPESTHVRDIGLASAHDELVWTYAAQHGFIIVSKDSDFHQRSFLDGPPPKVIWLRCGNRTTQEIMAILRSHHAACERFFSDPQAAFLEIG